MNLTRHARLILPFALTLTAAVAFATTFVPPKERIEKPYTNQKCLKDCHGEKTLAAGAPDGSKRSLHVDLDLYFESTHGQKGLWCIDCHQGADPNEHPRAGMPVVDCRACHSEKPPEGVFPADTASVFKEREIKPPEKKSLKGDGWTGSVHGLAAAKGVENPPVCKTCHTAHYVRKAADPASTVNAARLPETCGKCHGAQTEAKDPGGWLARFSIAGHGKGDFSQAYSECRCLSCHQGAAAHGEETVTGQSCPSCHRPGERIKEGKDGFHIKVGAGEGAGFYARAAYDVLFWGGAAGFLVAVLFWGITSIYRKQD